MKQLITIFTLMFAHMSSQIQLRITKFPDKTPSDAKIYMASNLNNWNPKDSQFEFKKNQEGSWVLNIPSLSQKIEYKITQGNWETAEASPNRVLEVTDQTKIIDIDIQSWTTPEKKKHTASQNVRILSENFKIPQLNTTRRIWIYLPPDYKTSSKKYPVIYMHDGQNLFDDYSSFSGEWSVDETLDELYKETGKSAIVIGIDSGGESRLAEYSPWNNQKYKTKGDGNLYVDFLVNTLKPYIDKTYRTEKQASKTIIMGSSMGGLISLYAAVKYPTVFGKAGSFSPAFWFVSKDLKAYLNQNKNNLSHSKFYFLAGKNEDETMVPEIEYAEQFLLQKSVPAKNIIVKIDEDGTHSENYWKRELKQALIWLLK